MTELPDRVERAFRDDNSFEQEESGKYTLTTTAFEGVVEVEPVDEGRIRFAITVRVPGLNAVTEGEVAPVVEDDWYRTLRLRVEDVGGIARGDHDWQPELSRDDSGSGEIRIQTELTEIAERRGVADSRAFIDFVEGTYVQGIIPGYEYTEPVSEILSKARQQGGSNPGGS